MLRTRADIEELEDQMLAPYAMRSRNSRGRRVAEPPARDAHLLSA